MSNKDKSCVRRADILPYAHGNHLFIRAGTPKKYGMPASLGSSVIHCNKFKYNANDSPLSLFMLMSGKTVKNF